MKYLTTAFPATAFLFLIGCATSQQVEKEATADSIELIGHEWMVQKIEGEEVLEETEPSLLFMEDGKLAGNASCNRILGNYTRKGNDELSFAPVGTTMMSCPEAQMEQERKFLDLLPEINRFEIDDSGTLLLKTEDGIAMEARQL